MRHTVTLRDGDLVLRPLTPEDLPALCALARECGDELRWLLTAPDEPEYYAAALAAPDQQPFVIEVAGEIAGSTRYGDIRAAHSGLEIGWTWLAEKGHGTGVDLRMKRLLLGLYGTLRDTVMSSVLREEWEHRRDLILSARAAAPPSVPGP